MDGNAIPKVIYILGNSLDFLKKHFHVMLVCNFIKYTDLFKIMDFGVVEGTLRKAFLLQ